MSKIIAYKSPHTGELFEHKKDYDRHLRRIYRDNAWERKMQTMIDEREARWAAFRETISDISQLPQAIIDNQDLFWETAAKQTTDFDICKRAGIYPKLVKFTEFALTYSDSVSNSHSCPKDGVTNWGGYVKDAPRGYPGWHGRISWIVEWPNKYHGHYPGGQLFKGSGIHTGTGGYGGKPGEDLMAHGYGAELFLSDWKGLEKSLFIQALKERRHAR